MGQICAQNILFVLYLKIRSLDFSVFTRFGWYLGEGAKNLEGGADTPDGTMRSKQLNFAGRINIRECSKLILFAG